jgi:hypothetical protein
MVGGWGRVRGQRPKKEKGAGLDLFPRYFLSYFLLPSPRETPKNAIKRTEKKKPALHLFVFVGRGAVRASWSQFLDLTPALV